MIYTIVPIEQRDYIFVAHLDQDLRGTGGWSVSQIMDAEINFAVLFGAFDEDEILVGYVVAQPVMDEAEIHIIGVDPMHQRQGLAGRLMDATVDALETSGVRAIFLEVRKSNVPAIGFYEKCGFTQVGVRKAYYPPVGSTGEKEDALVMKVAVKNYIYQKV